MSASKTAGHLKFEYMGYTQLLFSTFECDYTIARCGDVAVMKLKIGGLHFFPDITSTCVKIQARDQIHTTFRPNNLKNNYLTLRHPMSCSDGSTVWIKIMFEASEGSPLIFLFENPIQPNKLEYIFTDDISFSYTF